MNTKDEIEKDQLKAQSLWAALVFIIIILIFMWAIFGACDAISQEVMYEF